jgi:PKD repeat protein
LPTHLPGRRRVGAVVVLSCACAVIAPSAASAADTFTVPGATSVSFTGPKVRGYQLSGYGASRKKKGSFSATFFKKATKASQSHGYSFSKGVTVKANGSLSSGALKAKLGSSGSIAMNFHATKGLRTIALSKGCTGKKTRSRRGVLEGRLKLKIDKSFFKTVSLGSVPATLLVSSTQKCTSTTGGGKPATPAASLNSYAAGAAGFTAVKAKSGKVYESVTMAKTSGGKSSYHSITVSGLPGSTLSVAGDASKATVKGSGPITGSATFAASDYYDGGASGRISGTLAAHFDSIGTVKLFPGSAQGFLQKAGFKPPPPPNQAPSAGFDSSQDFSSRDVDFSDSSFDPDGSIASYAWAFGDGGTATTSSPRHTYAAAGTYTVTLTVTDNDGATDTATKQVEVLDPEF